MTHRKPNVVVVGSSNTDVVVRLPHLPKPGETVLATSLSTVQGGKGANQAVAASRLGASVTFIARLGSDAYGDAALTAFNQDRIDTRYVTRDKERPTGTAIIGVDESTGENSIFVVPGSNAGLSVSDIERAQAAIASADVLVCQLEVPLASVVAALRIAHQTGVRIILNPSPVQPLGLDILKMVSVLVPNEGEAELLAGLGEGLDTEALAIALLAAGPEYVLITLGSRGLLLAGHNGVARFGSVKVAEVRDTTGAGDCFTGALAVALAENQPMDRAINFASAAAAISVTRSGAQPSLPFRAEVEDWLV